MPRFPRLVVPALLALFCGTVTADNVDVAKLKKNFERPKSIPYLSDNAYSKDREALGKSLFFEPRLSGSGSMSCSTCHNPSLSWTDGLPKAVGNKHTVLGRRSPYILNLAWTEKMMWDGRLKTLEGQALGPLSSEAEMNGNLANVATVLKNMPGYAEMFKKAYPDQEVTPELMGKAIGIYERGLISGTAPFDKWIAGDEHAISAKAKQGFVLFNTKANCAACHSGWRFTDDSFQDIGLKSDDIGRGKFLHLKTQQHAFKTPGLRNISERANYMHDGSEHELGQVIDFYNRGGDVKRDSLSASIKPLGLSAEEKTQLLTFLQTLTSKDAAVSLPLLPR